MTNPPFDLTACALAEAVRSGELGALETTDAYLARIEAHDGALHAFHSVDADGARKRARELDDARARGEAHGALFGVPIALKDNMCLAGQEASCGSRILAGYRAPYTATFVQRLLDAGAVPLGMTSMDEFAMGSSGENSAHEVSRNPWDPTRTAGGSSSGSAVAVAADLAPIALGSDTGGSVRQPASFCGVYGLKPTYGRVSRYGLIAFGSSLDQVSPFAHDVRDLERVLQVISGHDERDSTSLPIEPFEPERPAELQSLVGLRIGVAKPYFDAGADPRVREVCEARLEVLRSYGAELVEIDLPHTAYAIPTYYVVATAEASSNLGRYDGSLYGARTGGDGSLQSMFAATRDAGFGEEVKRRILLGTYVLSAGYKDAWYNQALKVRTLIRRDFEAAFEAVDLIAGPTSPTPPFALGERAGDAIAMYNSDLCTVPASLAGLPALSVPAGFTADASRLPIGLQLIGPALSEGRLLRVAAALAAAPDAPPTHALDASAGGAA